MGSLVTFAQPLTIGGNPIYGQHLTARIDYGCTTAH
jgi:hypothetical protein